MVSESQLRPAPAEAAEDLPTLAAPAGFLSPGQILGNRYRIRSQLGRGGMGEVWRAFDLKLRVDVAIKALRDELLEHKQAVETLRQEVRVAREVISPNVCRVFDLLELDGRELVSMEYIDGTTLAEILRDRSPLELGETREIALQFLAGLEAIHQAGLVHRDVKPENVMVTLSGRVVVMDFGIAKVLATAGTGTVAGTPAYMAPEQEIGDTVDARADVFSAGVMLAEMMAPAGVREREARLALWRGVREQPPRLPESPWQAVLEQAVSRSADERFASAARLARALEEVTLRVEGAEDVTPYPGLAAFTEDDAKYFFGRELEVEEMWKKLRRPHLLAVVGQSGAGKSSFLRAGLLASRPQGWGHVICTPGNSPFAHLREALVTEVSGDTEAMKELVRGEDADALVSVVSRWRQRHKQVLVILDQFEELFTLNPEDVQSKFAELLGRLVLEADVHVLLSMRDDFLFHCSDQPALAPVFSELTLLRSPTGSSLRRALVQPALNCGYRFEDEALVDEMVAEIKQERGALPLVAFAAAALWERRDREAGLLTREAYEEIGGVGGALAQHAEATLERIGTDQIPLVRELFRNLVTAQGTRAARHRAELLSVFEQGKREAAGEILDSLIDARLLTSYELPAGEDDGDNAARHGHHSIEIIHESLLSAWPRLVRWQTQDEAGAQLRDQLRQAAQTWQERDRSDDLLWSGTAYREFQLWRESYRGGLTEAEESFEAGMVELAGRRRRRRRFAMVAVLSVLIVVVGVVGSLWRQAVSARLASDAAQLLALARLQLEHSPSGAVAYALASLEASDSSEARRFAVEALWHGPTASVLKNPHAFDVDFSPDGKWLVVQNSDTTVELWSHDGAEHRTLDLEAEAFAIGPGSDVLITSTEPRFTQGLVATARISAEGTTSSIRFWSFPHGELLRTQELEGLLGWDLQTGGRRVLTVTEDEDKWLVHSWPLSGGTPTLLGQMQREPGRYPKVDPTGTWLSYHDGETGPVALRRLDGTGPAPLVRHEGEVIDHKSAFDTGIWFSQSGERFATGDLSGEIRLWSLTDRSEPTLLRTLSGHTEPVIDVTFQSGDRRLATASLDGTARIWSLEEPSDADPLVLKLAMSQTHGVAFHPQGNWLATTASGSPFQATGVAVWPLTHSYPRVFRGDGSTPFGVTFAPDGSWVAATFARGSLRLWPLAETAGDAGRVLFEEPRALLDLAVDGQGRNLLAGRGTSGTRLVPLDGGEPRLLEGFTSQAWYVALSPEGRFAAAAGGELDPKDAVIRIWDLETEDVQILDPGAGQAIGQLQFTSEDRLVSGGKPGIRVWNLDQGTFATLREEEEGKSLSYSLSSDSRFLASVDRGGPSVRVENLQDGDAWDVTSHDRVFYLAIDEAATILVTADRANVVRVGPASGEAPHLLVGHEGKVRGIAISPDRRHVASVGEDSTVRLWPVPEGQPFHTLAYEDLIEHLRTLTNLRVVPDEEVQGGYRLERTAFPGWEVAPTW